MLYGLRFSPDGKRLIAGDYPGGVVVVWDVESGKELKRIETGFGLRATTDYFFLSPDWQTLFVSHEKRQVERLEKDGKRLNRWEGDGAVLAWDLNTGQLRRIYKHQPPRYIRGIQLSADGKRFFTLDQLPGIYERGPKWAVSLWNVETGQYCAPPDNVQSYGLISPDGRVLAAAAHEDEDGFAQALKWIDMATGREKLSIPVRDQNVWLRPSAFSRDEKLLVGDYRVFERRHKWDRWQSWLKWWDCATGREVASFEEEKNSFHGSAFSPDGQTLAVINWGGEETKLYLFRGSDRRPATTFILGKKTKGERLVLRLPVFSPDGKWLALVAQVFPDTPGAEPDVQDLPQPRIQLVDVAAGAIRETLVAPQGIAASACFSPDGKTLATSGHGRVLLWNLAELPGGTGGARR